MKSIVILSLALMIACQAWPQPPDTQDQSGTNNIQDGTVLQHDKQGHVFSKLTYKNGLRNGPFLQMARCPEDNPDELNSTLCTQYVIGSYFNDMKHGEWKYYNKKDSSLVESISYENDRLHGSHLIYGQYTVYYDANGKPIPYADQGKTKVASQKQQTYVEQERQYSFGMKHGTWIINKPHFGLKETRHYEYDKLEGEQIIERSPTQTETFLLEYNQLLTCTVTDTTAQSTLLPRSFQNGNGRIHFRQYPIPQFLQNAGLDPNENAHKLFGNERYNGYLDFKNGQLVDGAYPFTLHSPKGDQPYSIVVRNHLVAEKNNYLNKNP